ncbi:MAG: 16S rRNA processing protein RimM [Odoribacteraceae bacterium]|jgi:16S rRNA processing protein RimM|nr:16S rRNA processing protein RimM [Odoribacteraceae bacterium]
MIDAGDHARIGKIGSPYRLEGAVIVYTTSDLFSLQPNEPVFILLEGAPVPFYIAKEGIRRRNATSCIVKFDFVDSAGQAGHLAGHDLFARAGSVEEEEEEAGTLEEEGGWIGFTARDLLTGETGEVVDMANYSGNVVLSIRMFSREILVPLSGGYVKEVLPEERLLRVEIPQELKELNAGSS